MTAPLAHCASCGRPFDRKRAAQRTCSPACKKALFRAEKRDTGHSVTSEGSDALQHTDAAMLDGVITRIWGPNRLSEIELRVMKLEPTCLAAPGRHPLAAASTLYRRIGE